MTVTLTVESKPKVPRKAADTDERVAGLFERCEWYELVLLRHGFTVERLMKLSRRVTNDYVRANVPYLTPDRRDDLADFVLEKALNAVIRFQPDHPTQTYSTRGGEHFDSWIADLMQNRCIDWYRSKAEGNGDRRYNNDNRIVLDDDPDPADHDADFEALVDERRRARWQQAAASVGWPLEEWIAISLDRAASDLLTT